MVDYHGWSEEEDDFLRRLAAAGGSSSEIAAQLAAIFGAPRTRSSVCGRASRLGVTLNSTAPGSHKAKRAVAARTSEPKPPKPVATKPAMPKPAAPKTARPETRLHPGNIATKAARLKLERESGVRDDAAAELAAMEAAFEAAAGPNPGVLFLERDMAKQCAMPMPGWDAAAITEKRVCGKPVAMRRVQFAGLTVLQGTAWCQACTIRATATARTVLDVRALTKADRSVRAA